MEEGPRDPQKRLRFWALRGKSLAFNKRTAIVSCDLEASLGARLALKSLAFKKCGALHLSDRSQEWTNHRIVKSGRLAYICSGARV